MQQIYGKKVNEFTRGDLKPSHTPWNTVRHRGNLVSDDKLRFQKSAEAIVSLWERQKGRTINGCQMASLPESAEGRNKTK